MIESGQKDAAPAVDLVGNDGTGLKLKTECRLDAIGGDLKQGACAGNKLIGRQAAVPLIHRLRQCKRNAGADADQGGLLDPELGSDLIRGPKADPADVARETVRILGDELDSVGARRS